ncbi:MAG: hypothetical protein KDD58_00690 [Bdellovibrionales bacterium]|nr:hypothetical protein [Bdellovibrionales bacterium]
MKKYATLFFFLAFSVVAQAGDFQWSGLYRIEGNSIKNSSLDDSKKEKAYGLHHLILRPRIEAADGITIRSRFDIFNFNDGVNNYPSNQLGAIFGSGVGDGTPTSTSDSSVVSQAQQPNTLQVSELYLTLVQEFGALVAGRVPIQFGLGMVHNAGNGDFDHWMDNRDLVGYKIVMGNLFILPMYGKVSEGTAAGATPVDLQKNDDVTDIMVQFQYENPESGMEMGLFYQGRSANSGNDVPQKGADYFIGGTGAKLGRMSTRNFSLYGLKNTKNFSFGVEASWQEGNLGIVTSQGKDVEFSGYGLATEIDYRPENSKMSFGFKAGYATGDNPETDDKFEGFIFDRNYDVALLLFNHTLGQKNFFRTELIGTQDPGAGSITHNNADIEAISNVIYFAPSINYKWSDRWSLEATLVTGWLQVDPLAGVDVDKALGYELDLGFNFKPNDRVTWINQIGLFSPGSAFKAGDVNNFDTNFAYGLATKAAISF